MRNNEKFIKSWEKNREKGKIKYIVSNALLFVAIYWALTIIINVIRGDGLSNLFAYFDVFIVGLIGILVGLYTGWDRSNEKYDKLIGNK